MGVESYMDEQTVPVSPVTGPGEHHVSVSDVTFNRTCPRVSAKGFADNPSRWYRHLPVELTILGKVIAVVVTPQDAKKAIGWYRLPRKLAKPQPERRKRPRKGLLAEMREMGLPGGENAVPAAGEAVQRGDNPPVEGFTTVASVLPKVTGGLLSEGVALGLEKAPVTETSTPVTEVSTGGVADAPVPVPPQKVQDPDVPVGFALWGEVAKAAWYERVLGASMTTEVGRQKIQSWLLTKGVLNGTTQT